MLFLYIFETLDVHLLLSVSFVTCERLVIHIVILESLKMRIEIMVQLVVSSLAGGEGDGTPLQYSCLANPMDGRAW